jgi:rod shape-determining protein MreC
MDFQSSPKFFIRGTSILVRAVICAALSLVLMASDSRFQYLSKVRQVGMSFMYPMQWISNRPESFWGGINEYVTTHAELRSEINHLKDESLVLSANLQQLEALETENQHLRELLNLSSTPSIKVKPAQIIAILNQQFTHKVMIDQGENSGVILGQAVIDAQGVIGQVTRVFWHSSEVTLLTDRAFAIPIQIERNGLRAIAYGRGAKGYISMPYLPANVDIQQGDRLLTSGIDGTYPPGLLVGEVSLMKTSDNSPFAIVHATPLGGVHNFRHVLLIDNNEKAAALKEVEKVMLEDQMQREKREQRNKQLQEHTQEHE